MDKSLILSMLMSFVASNDVLKFEPSQVGLTVDWPPAFCNKLACPRYKMVNKTKDYEERIYAPSSWVSTNILGVKYKEAAGTMFMRLFEYIQGDNVKKEKIAMTAPVKIRVKPGPGPACESNFTESFYVDPSQGRPPVPSDKTVFLDSADAMTVYVREFGGFARTYEDWKKEALVLGKALKAAGLDFVTEHYFTLGYDAPFKLFNRHNEIWFIKK